MRIFIVIVSIVLLSALLVTCATRKQGWDSGAQKQEAVDEELREHQEDVLRNQFPGGRY